MAASIAETIAAAPPPAVLTSPLEIVELELALSLIEGAGDDFASALQPALDSAGAALLFVLPVHDRPDSSRVAALSIGAGAERRIVLAVLAGDGRTVRLEQTDDGKDPLAGLAASFTRVMERMPHVAAKGEAATADA